MDMKKLLEAVTKFAGEPSQKPGDQVRGTDKATPKAKGEHPFKGQLVGDSVDPKGNLLSELSQEANDKSLEWDLAEAWNQFKEEVFKDTSNRPSRKGSRPKRGHENQPCYKTVNEYKDQVDNFTADDLQKLAAITDLATLKARAIDLISTPSKRPMKPEKVAWFKQAIESKTNAAAVIKLMWDLLLSGEGHAVVGSRSSMNPNSYRRKFNESVDGDGEVANAVVAEVIKLIGEGHTEVSPDVITTKVSAALGRPFMLKDLVAANNSSPELQHYISSINPGKIKFSTDILTVKNEDPMKEKQAAQDGVSKMANRAASRPRLGEAADAGISKSAETKFHKKLDKLVHNTFGRRKEEMKEESSSIKGPHGYMDVERKNGVTTVKRREWDSASEKRTNVKGGTWFPKSNRHGEGEGTSVKTGSGVSSNFGTRRKSPAIEPDDYTEREDDIYETYDVDNLEEGVTSPEIKQAYQDIFKTDPHTAERKAAVEKYQQLRKDAMAAKKSVKEDEYDDEDDYEEEDQGFFVAISDEEDGVFIGMLVKEDGKWRERRYKGNAPYNWGGTYMGYLTPQDVMSWIRKDYGNTYQVEGPMDEDEANEYLDYMSESTVNEMHTHYDQLKYNGKLLTLDRWPDGHLTISVGHKVLKSGPFAQIKAVWDKLKGEQVTEGWESGPEERAPRERDPDWEYDQRRQEKLDRAADAQPKKTTYKLIGRGPNREPNWDFGLGEFDSQEAAIAARSRLMADPDTPNPRDIGIQTIRRSVAESKGSKKKKVTESVDDLLTKFREGWGQIEQSNFYHYEIKKVMKHFCDSMRRSLMREDMDQFWWTYRHFSSNYPDAFVNFFDDCGLHSIDDVKSLLSLEETKRDPRKVITQKLQDIERERNPQPAADDLEARAARAKAEYAKYVAKMKKKNPNYIPLYKVDEAGSAIGGGTVGGTAKANTGTASLDPNAAKQATTALNTFKAATGVAAPATNIAKSLDKVTKGQPVGSSDMKVLEPVMKDIATVATDPKLANQYKSLAGQINQTQAKQQK